jgi:hypothetical protein
MGESAVMVPTVGYLSGCYWFCVEGGVVMDGRLTGTRPIIIPTAATINGEV